VSAVVVAYGPSPLLEDCVTALLGSAGLDVEIVVVDNGGTGDAVDRLAGRESVRLIRPGHNTGFAGGCNLGAREASGEYLALVNPDALVEPDALARLVEALQEPGVGLASASLRLWSAPEIMNSAGNPVHYLGLSWAGALGEPASAHRDTRDIPGATGAALALRRETWTRMGGFWDEMFAYYEDTEFSLRCWQRGLRVVYVPDAVVLHHYEFSRNDHKMFLLERNRLLMLLTLYEARTLLLLAPALLALELAVLRLAARQGWLRQKLRSWWWLLTHASLVRTRRAMVHAARKVPDRELAWLLTADFQPGEEVGMTPPAVLSAGSRAYWSVARRFLARPHPRR
jgi:GT2 family glycosyltransferase